jgi:hypothetical protein
MKGDPHSTNLSGREIRGLENKREEKMGELEKRIRKLYSHTKDKTGAYVDFVDEDDVLTVFEEMWSEFPQRKIRTIIETDGWDIADDARSLLEDIKEWKMKWSGRQ